jgi:type VI secretion system protein ImpL
MKRVLIGILIFLVYLAAVIGIAFALHFSGTRFTLFIVILGLLGAIGTAVVLWTMSKTSGGSGFSTGPDTPDAINLTNLLRDADGKIRQTGRAKSLASLPLIYIVGDENSAKTQTVLQSGLDPELIAGNVYQDGIVVQTQLANLWLAGNYVIAEAGGALLRQPPLWQRLVKATIPARLGSVFGDSRLPARSVVVCVSIERIMAPSTSEQIKALAQTLNERLRQLSQTLGIALPVYVLFTKLDTVPPFAEYAGKLADEEVKLPIGSLLSSLSSGTGLYTEQATATIGGKFDQLVYALSEFRLDVLSRGGELKDLARAYEFPRDLRKLRGGIVAFLAEVARPSQIGVNPFLRGFFFAGMRAHLVEDVLEIGPAQTQQATAPPPDAGATRIFSLAAMQQQAQQPAPTSRRGGTRKIAQWVFLPHLFSKILLADKAALETSRASTRTSFLKRTLLATASAIILIVFALITISFFNNRALEQRVATAAAAPVSPVSSGSYAAQGDLASLDKLRAVVAELEGYRKNGAPFMDHFGLYRGDALYPVACQAYSNKFRTLLLSPTQSNITAKLSALQSPHAADADYGATYNPLKAYLITATDPNPDTSPDTVEFLPNALASEWAGSGQPAAEVARLAQEQFTFYAGVLSMPSSCLAPTGGPRNEPLIAKTRYYLSGFQGFEHVYQSMLAAANHKVPGFNYNAKFLGSSQYIVDTYPIPGAFSKDGFAFMQDAMLHPDRYFRGEEWVLGPSLGPPPDRAALAAQLRQAYINDYLLTWRAYLNKAQFIGYKNFPEAGVKLSALDSNTSALLELFSLVSNNTAVSAPEISSVFQAPQSIVPAASGPDVKLIGATNQAYIQALQALETSVKTYTATPTNTSDPAAVAAAAAPVTQAALTADVAAETLRNTFPSNPAINDVNEKSFALLEAPITSTKNLASNVGNAKTGGDLKTFCAQIGPVLQKFPFNPASTVEATPEEAAQIFAPTTGSFATFYNSSLSKLVVLQGSQYVQAPGSAVKIGPGSLTFLNSAQKISSTLFAAGPQPALDFMLTEVRSPGVADAVLNIDGRQINAAGQTATFHWVSQPSSTITLATKDFPFPRSTGSWSVFHLAYANPQAAPNRLKEVITANGQTAEVVLFDVSGAGAPLLNPEFMKNLHCVASFAH